MNVVERAKSVCLTPADTWNTVAAEASTTSQLLTGYVAPLAAASAAAQFVGLSIVGVSVGLLGTYRVPFARGLGLAITSFVLALVGVFVLGAIIDALAPSFGASKSPQQANKVAAYAFTPAWVASIAQILPALGVIAALGALYSLYVLYLGLPKLMKCPEEKAVAYTAVVVVCAIVLFAVVGSVAGTLGAMPTVGGLTP